MNDAIIHIPKGVTLMIIRIFVFISLAIYGFAFADAKLDSLCGGILRNKWDPAGKDIDSVATRLNTLYPTDPDEYFCDKIDSVTLARKGSSYNLSLMLGAVLEKKRNTIKADKNQKKACQEQVCTNVISSCIYGKLDELPISHSWYEILHEYGSWDTLANLLLKNAENGNCQTDLLIRNSRDLANTGNRKYLAHIKKVRKYLVPFHAGNQLNYYELLYRLGDTTVYDSVLQAVRSCRDDTLMLVLYSFPSRIDLEKNAKEYQRWLLPRLEAWLNDTSVAVAKWPIPLNQGDMATTASGGPSIPYTWRAIALRITGKVLGCVSFPEAGFGSDLVKQNEVLACWNEYRKQSRLPPLK